MKVAIVDDESDLRATLRLYLQQFKSHFIVEEANSVASGVKLVNSFQPDLLFLDVMMGDGTGFDLLKQLQHRELGVIIVSGHQEYALQAFRFSALDYLVKPIDPDELNNALFKVYKQKQNDWQQLMEVMSQGMQGGRQQERKLVLKDLNVVYVVSVSSVIRCEAADNYTTFFLADQSPIVVSKPLKEYDELLNPLGFFRVHQSHLININYLKQYNKRDGGSVLMKDGSEVPVASRKRELLLAALAKLA